MSRTSASRRTVVWRILFFFIGNTIITRHTKCKKKLSNVVDNIGALRDKLRVITLSKSYTVNDQTFASLELAQQYEIITLLKAEAGTNDIIGIATAAQVLVGNKAKVLDILTTKPNSRVRARAINGAKRTRKAKDVAPAKAPETAKAV